MHVKSRGLTLVDEARRQWNGARWTRVESPTREPLNGVHAVGDEVWAAGLEGTILRWHASRWTVFESGTTAVLRSIWARNDRDVWVAGRRLHAVPLGRRDVDGLARRRRRS
jgi:hypothetical protein